MTQPTSIDEFLQEYVDKFVAPTIPGTLGAAFAGQVQGWLKVKLTTLVEQAKMEGREEAVDYIDLHYCSKAPRDTASADFNELTEVLEAARTISSDKK